MSTSKTILTSVGVFSCAKVSGVIYAAFGLIAGLFLTFFSLLGAAIGFASVGSSDALYGVLFGFGSVIVLPVLYGVLGFIGGVIAAVLYNLVAGMIGGIEMEFETVAGPE